MKVAILGASCFGLNFAKHLTQRGDDVMMISRSPIPSPAFTLGLENSPLFHYHAKQIGRAHV